MVEIESSFVHWTGHAINGIYKETSWWREIMKSVRVMLHILVVGCHLFTWYTCVDTEAALEVGEMTSG